jgi:Ca2+-binding RTX toxin-like protein
VRGGSAADTLKGDNQANVLTAAAGTTRDGTRRGRHVPDHRRRRTDTIVEVTGEGSDTLDYSLYTAAVTVNLTTGTATSTAGITNIENVTGGAGNDVIVGDGNANVLYGGAGNDTITGGAGADILGAARASTHWPAEPKTTHTCWPAGPTRSLKRRRGSDTLDYSPYGSAVTVMLAGRRTGVSGIVTNIENVTGGAGNDVLTGDANVNVLSGGPGATR